MYRSALASISALALAGCSVLPGGSHRSAPAPAPPRRGAATSIPTSPSARQCQAQLAGMGANFSPVPDRYPVAGCSLVGTVQLVDLASDNSRLGIANIGPVTCALSLAFAGFARFGADRAAQQILGSPLRAIETFGSYSCRDVAGTGRRSAHASAAAIDISGFVLADGRRITVKADWDGGSEAERRFLRVVHDSACKRFDTVLGPGYNAAHKDHFHVEGVISGRSFCR